MNIIYKGTIVRCRETMATNTTKPQKKCLCCGKEIKNGSKITVMFNNYKKLPNMILHSECFAEDKQKGRINDLLSEVEQSYKQWKWVSPSFGS